MAGGWEEVKTEDGRVYYYHRLTRATRWVKPDEKLESAMEERIQQEEAQKQAAVEERRRQREVEKEKKDGEEKERDELNSSTAAEVKEWAAGKSVSGLLMVVLGRR
jgi:membrane protein involved in colicin uptake